MDFYSYLKGGVPTATAQDADVNQSLAEHDKTFHPNGYKKGDECKLRDAFAAYSETDNMGVPAASMHEGDHGQPTIHTRLQGTGRMALSQWPTDRGYNGKSIVAVHGLENIPKDQQVEAIYKMAEENLEPMEEFTVAVAKQLGGKAQFRPGESASKRLKDKGRAKDKADRWFRDASGKLGDYSQLNDIIGTTIELPEDGSFVEADEMIRGMLPQGCEVACMKPYNTYGGPGYRDVKASIRFPNGGLAEMILVEPYINNAKFNRGGHTAYEAQRVFQSYGKDDDVHHIVRDPADKAKAIAAQEQIEKLTHMIYSQGDEAPSLEDFEKAKEEGRRLVEETVADPTSHGLPADFFTGPRGAEHQKAFMKIQQGWDHITPPPDSKSSNPIPEAPTLKE